MSRFFKRHHVAMIALTGLVVVSATIAAQVARRGAASTESGALPPRVTLLAVTDYQKNRAAITADGAIESLEQAELRSQTVAPVQKIYVSLGDKVSVGQLLVSLKSADVAAQLAQAEAGVAGQEARLAEIQKGARDEDITVAESNLDQAKRNLATQYANTVTTLNDAYAKSDDAVRKQTNQLFVNSESANPQLVFSTTETQAEINTSNERYISGVHLKTWKAELTALGANPTPATIETAIDNAQAHLAVIREYLNQAMDAVVASVGLSPSTLDLYKLSITTGRNNVNAGLTVVSGAEQAIQNQKSGIDQATETLAKMRNGATPEQIAGQTAAVAQAKASVDGLRAQLEKTAITSPIAGTIAAIPVRVGELITLGASVISIVNVNGLQVRGYVSDADIADIEEGANVLISNTVKGKVSRVAPSVGSQSKKVEVDVLVTDPLTSGLVVGQNVSFVITAKQRTADTNVYLLPLQAVRITANAASVYTVSDSHIAEHAVQLGEVRGELLEVKQGIAPDMHIVSAVYELKAGDEVTVE